MAPESQITAHYQPPPVKTHMPSPLAGVGSPQQPQRMPRPALIGGPESLARSMQTILSKMGVFSPERQAELDRVRERQEKSSRLDAALAYRQRCGVWPRDEDAALDNTDFPKQMLSPADFAKYLHLRDQLATLLEFPGILVPCNGESAGFGTGKTHLAAALVHAFCDRGLEAFFTTAVDFYTKIKSTFGEKGRTLEDLILRFRRYELLVIDEIEVRSDSQWENSILRDLINARYSSFRATVILTNKTARQINGDDGPAYFHPAILDRIAQDGSLLPCDWPSMRRMRT